MMKPHISSEKDNTFFKRRELTVTVDHERAATPSKAALQQLLAKQLGHDVTSIDIVNIFTGYGTMTSSAKVFVWKEKKVADLSLEKKQEQKEGEEAGKGAEAAQSETPTQTKSEEPATEQKTS